MQSFRDRLIHVHRCRGITRRVMRKILLHDPTLNQIYLKSSSTISQLYSLPMKNATLFFKDLHNNYLIQQIKEDNNSYRIITIVDENYPGVLKTIKDPPIVFYALGNTSLLCHTPALSVIGTRNPSNEAIAKIKHVVSPLLDNDWLIVSGMAKGVDRYAHVLALREKGKTVAVLGGGFHHIYPKQNTSLFHQIAERGLVISEYPPDIPPKKHHFPERNRLISGLCFGTLVIEATEKSGTLITVDQALDQGREVYALPGSPLIPQSQGCHRMIQDGAKLVMDSIDILEDWETIGKHLYNL